MTKQYMLLFYETEAERSRSDNPKEAPAYWAAWNAYVGAISQTGIVRGGNGLQAPRSATTVRVAGGKRQVQDGPFADTREHLGGYFVIETDSLDTALDWAARSPNIVDGCTEVRPVLPPESTPVA